MKCNAPFCWSVSLDVRYASLTHPTILCFCWLFVPDGLGFFDGFGAAPIGWVNAFCNEAMNA
jgi:hypothetical protein